MAQVCFGMIAESNQGRRTPPGWTPRPTASILQIEADCIDHAEVGLALLLETMEQEPYLAAVEVFAGIDLDAQVVTSGFDNQKAAPVVV